MHNAQLTTKEPRNSGINRGGVTRPTTAMGSEQMRNEHGVGRIADRKQDASQQSRAETNHEHEELMITSSRTLSIVDYRIMSPNTAEVPTLTQLGLIGAILARVHQKASLRARRRERFQRIRMKFVEAFTLKRRVCRVPLLPTAQTAPPALAKPA